jgi:hypothetical protein
MIACRINDSNWIVTDFDFRIGTSFHASNYRDSLYFFGYPKSNSLLRIIRFQIFDRIKTGSAYRFNDTTIARVTTDRVSIGCNASSTYGQEVWTDATDGSITFTKFSGTYTIPPNTNFGAYDPNAIMSGTFQFVIPFPNCDTIRVTDGRFDINYSNN